MIHYTESTTRTIGSWYNGREYGEMWGYVYDRLWQMSDFEEFTNLKSNDGIPDGESNVVWFYGKAYKLKEGYDRHDVLTGSPIPGGAKYKDMNGDGIINSGSNTVDDPGDRVKIGNSLPRYEASTSTSTGKASTSVCSSRALANATFGLPVSRSLLTTV